MPPIVSRMIVFMVSPLAVLSDKVKRAQIVSSGLISICHDLVSQFAPFVELDDVITAWQCTFKSSVVAVLLFSDFHDVRLFKITFRLKVG